jgi:hypothetical protein
LSGLKHLRVLGEKIPAGIDEEMSKHFKDEEIEVN